MYTTKNERTLDGDGTLGRARSDDLLSSVSPSRGRPSFCLDEVVGLRLVSVYFFGPGPVFLVR